MSNDFGGLSLSLEPVRGFRSWKVQSNGVLKSASQRYDWAPGENRADNPCTCNPKKSEDESWSELTERAKGWRVTEHDFLTSQCGFYAYLDHARSEYGYTDQPVTGVIEGYGETVIGTKGFRAKRAKISAIAIEPIEAVWEMADHVVKRIRANYPGIPIFESQLAMIAEFPLSRTEDFAEVDA
jgi:hypothetical protein